jgi:hypothetical protein
MGTVIRPVSKAEEYDVDLGLYFCWDSGEGSGPAAKQLKEWVQGSVLRAIERIEGVKSAAVPPKERCSRVHYEKQFHIDIPVYHLSESTDRRRLATETKGWESSDPKAIYLWFKGQAGNPERAQLRRVVRYLKAWAALEFKENADSRPSSILLTVLATEAFVTLSNELDDEDALCAVVSNIYTRLAEDLEVLNPVDRDENLNRLSEGGLTQFLTSLSRLNDICTRALDCEDESAAAIVWDEAFSYLLQLPVEDQSVEFDEANSGRALMALPDIDIDVRDANGGFRGTYRNEVPQVPKGCQLKFRIINPAVVPDFAVVSWVVRNDGVDAIAVNDLGHSKVGVRTLECDEKTAYNGRHFMDCTVRVNGQVFAVRRIPVYVREPTFKMALPKKPWYRRYVKRRR